MGSYEEIELIKEQNDVGFEIYPIALEIIQPTIDCNVGLIENHVNTYLGDKKTQKHSYKNSRRLLSLLVTRYRATIMNTDEIVFNSLRLK